MTISTNVASGKTVYHGVVAMASWCWYAVADYVLVINKLMFGSSI